MARPKAEIGAQPKVVVTPRMLESGVEALAAWRKSGDHQIVAAVYRAMAARAPGAEVGNVTDVTRTVIETLTRLGYSARRDDPTT